MEDLTAEEEAGPQPAASEGPDPSLDYNPTAGPPDFDFPEEVKPEEEPKKKGLLGRFKKK